MKKLVSNKPHCELAYKACNSAHRHFNRKRLVYAIIITAITLVIEIAGGILSNSLALLSDAAHMFSHLFALAVSYFAIILTLKPPNPKKTYGYYRAEILAAFVNGLTLFLIVFIILYGAYERFKHPISIQSGEMFVVAAIGLFVNIITALLLHSGSREDINVKGAFLHALGDMISSIGVVVAAIIIYFTQLTILDTIVSVLIALIIIFWAYKLIRDSAHILLEGTPKDLNLDDVIMAIEDVIAKPALIHHIHVWEISTNIYALTAHVSVDRTSQDEITDLLQTIKNVLEKKFNILHATIQFECRAKKGVETIDKTIDGQPFVK